MKGTSFLAQAAKRLEGKVALITGGASGIGESTARLFVRHGARVIIADVQDDLGHSVCNDMGCKDSISYVHCNVTNESDIQKAVDMAIQNHGKLDIMFNNAGIAGKADPRIQATDFEDLKKVFDVNFFGAFLGAKHAARVMVPARKGTILFNSSLSSVINGHFPYAYLASKHAVVGLAKNLCVELGQYGIRVNCISPHALVTPIMLNAMPGVGKEEMEKVLSSAANLKEAVLRAEDVAEAALYLGSDEAKYISGVNLCVDGGFSTTNAALRDIFKGLIA